MPVVNKLERLASVIEEIYSQIELVLQVISDRVKTEQSSINVEDEPVG